MKRNLSIVVALLATVFVGCASAPQRRPEQRALESQADATVQAMVTRDPSLADLLASSAGYAVFPEIGEGGFIVGGTSGVGVVYQRFRPIGYVEMRGGTVGFQAGGQTFSELVVFESDEALQRLIDGTFEFNADLTATAIQSGAGAQAQFRGGTAVFIDDESGLMAGARIGGESLSFQAK